MLTVLVLVGAIFPAVSYAADYPSTVTGDHPVSYWRLNETSGMVASDRVGRNPGTISGATLNQPGPIAGDASMRFDGAGEINLGSDPSLRPPTNWSIEAWFKASPSDAAACANQHDRCNLYRYHAFGFAMVMDPQGHVGGGFYATGFPGSDAGSQYGVTSPAAYDDGAWHYAVLVRDTHALSIYIDGTVVASTPVAEPTTFYCCEDVAAIANDGACHCGAVTGWESEVAFYDYALMPDQIRAHYQAAGVTGPRLSVHHE